MKKQHFTINGTNKDKMYMCLVNFNLDAAIELMRETYNAGFNTGAKEPTMSEIKKETLFKKFLKHRETK